VGAPLLTPVKGTPPDTRPTGGLGAGSDPSAVPRWGEGTRFLFYHSNTTPSGIHGVVPPFEYLLGRASGFAIFGATSQMLSLSTLMS